jgi:hypothetical protein
MILTEVHNDPPMIDIDIPELESFDFETYFSLPSSRINYGNLEVDEGRLTIPTDNSLHTELCMMMGKPIYEITKKLMSMDKHRYPLFSYKNFKDFYRSNVLSRNRKGILGTIDHNGWSQPWHLDNRFILLSASINIQDNETSTYFATKDYGWDNGGTNFNHCELIYTGRKNKFTGTAWLNTEHTWHCVPKIKEDQRKTILFNVFL